MNNDKVFLPRIFAEQMAYASISAYPKESTGHVAFRQPNGHSIYVTDIAIPQDIKNGYTESEHGDSLRDVILAMKGRGAECIGGFHSHTDKLRKKNRFDLSDYSEDSDTGFIQHYIKPFLEGAGFVPRSWVEFIAWTEHKKYKQSEEPRWAFQDFGRKVKMRIRTEPREGYEIMLVAWELEDNGNYDEWAIEVK